MARSYAPLLICLLAVITLLRATEAREPVNVLAPAGNTKAAVLYEQPKGVKPFTFVTVPFFPGTKFYITFCGGPNVDREITIDKSKIVYRQNRGPSGNPMNITYVFATATLQTIVITYRPADLKEFKTVVTSIELSATLDRASDFDVQVVNDGNRQAAIGGLKALIKYIEMFSRPNSLAACMAYLPQGPPEWANQPYSPRLLELTAYLKKTLNTIKAFKPVR